MIDIAYESFVNDIAMELFGLSKKEKEAKKAHQLETIRNMSDKDYATACMQQTANIIFSSYDQFSRNQQAKDLIMETTQHEFENNWLDTKIVNSDHLDDHPVYFKSYKYKPVFIAEKFISGDLDDANVKMKTQSLNCNATAPVFGFNGIVIENRSDVDKWYPNHMPKILVYNQAKNCSTPVYDDHVSVMVVCDKENGKFTWFIMTGVKETLKNAHAGKLISAQQHLKGTTESLDIEALEFFNPSKPKENKVEKKEIYSFRFFS